MRATKKRNVAVLPSVLRDHGWHDDMDTLAERTAECWRGCQGQVRAALGSAIELGHLLRLAKERLKHGEWTGWLERCGDINPRTAQLYMQIARVPLADSVKSINQAREAVAATVDQASLKRLNMVRATPAMPQHKTIRIAVGPTSPLVARTPVIVETNRQPLIPARPVVEDDEPRRIISSRLQIVDTTPLLSAASATFRVEGGDIVRHEPKPPTKDQQIAAALAQLEGLAKEIAEHDIDALCDRLEELLARYRRLRLH